MRRWLGSTLVAVLLVTGCGDPPPPRPKPHVYTIMYGVLVSDPVRFWIDYTGDDGKDVRANGEPGKGWAGKASITHTPSGWIGMRVMADGPITLPDGSVRWPRIQCRIDVDGVMADSQDKENAIECTVGVSFSDLKSRPSATPQGPTFEGMPARPR